MNHVCYIVYFVILYFPRKYFGGLSPTFTLGGAKAPLGPPVPPPLLMPSMYADATQIGATAGTELELEYMLNRDIKNMG